MTILTRFYPRSGRALTNLFLPALLIVGAALNGCSNSEDVTQAKAVGDAYYKYVSQRNYTAAYSLLNNNLKAQVTPSDLKQVWDVFNKSNGGIKQAFIRRYNTGAGEKPLVLLDYFLVYPEIQCEDLLQVEKEEGKWKISRFYSPQEVRNLKP